MGADAVLGALEAATGPVLLTGPVSPDGDSLGACLALQRVLAQRGVAAAVCGQASYRYGSLPGIQHLLPDDEVGTDWQLVVVLDGDRHRLTPPVARAFEAAAARAIVDHHGSTVDDGYDHFWVESGAASTTAMLYRAFVARDWPVDAQTAQLLYVGLVFDTGCFRYSNATASVLHMAGDLVAHGFDHAQLCARVMHERRPEALRLQAAVYDEATFDGGVAVGHVPLELQARVGMVPGDLEGLVESLVHTVGVEVAVLFVHRTPDTVKLSLRSRGAVDVAAVAQSLAPTGGGHRKAAGVSIPPARVGEAIAALRAAVSAP